MRGIAPNAGGELGDAGTTVPGPPMESNPSMPVSPEGTGDGQGKAKSPCWSSPPSRWWALVVTGTVLVIRAVDARPAAVSEQTDGSASDDEADDGAADDDDGKDDDADDAGNDADDTPTDDTESTAFAHAGQGLGRRHRRRVFGHGRGRRGDDRRRPAQLFLAVCGIAVCGRRLYLPVYLAYTAKNPGRPSDSAGEMLRFDEQRCRQRRHRLRGRARRAEHLACGQPVLPDHVRPEVRRCGRIRRRV